MKTLDSHQHFWTLERNDYGWLTQDIQPLYRDFLPQHLQSFLTACHVEKTIVVQAAPTTAETYYLLDLADKHSFIAGVVGWVDFDNPSQAIADLKQLTQHKKFLGVRPMIQDITPNDWILNTDFDSIFEMLIQHNKTFDALVMPHHLNHLITLLRRYPALKVVINHGAKPAIRDNKFNEWQDKIDQISLTQAYCKLSGLLTEKHSEQPDEVIAPYINHLLQSFGYNRIMWGSDWPVLELTGNYENWHTTALQATEHLAPSEKEAIFRNNAYEFYGI